MNILEAAAQELELLAKAIREKNFEQFQEMTYDSEGAYCQGEGRCIILDLDAVYHTLEKEERKLTYSDEYEKEMADSFASSLVDL